MATNQIRYIGNVLSRDPNPLVRLGLFQAGATAAIKRGEIIERTADSSTRWTPVTADASHTADLAIANEEIKNGDRAGYYEIIVPRPGDVFEFDLATASAIAEAAALYYSSSEALAASGNNIIGYAVGQEHFPVKQGHLADDAGPDQGETIRSTSKVCMTFKLSTSWYVNLFK